jgi:hypothetical protein
LRPVTASKRTNTIIWHVDDLKLSHVDPTVFDNINTLLEEQFGKEAPLTIRHGKIHDYLGMQLDFSTPGKLVISMVPYIQSMIDEMPENMIGTAANPALTFLR